MRLPRKLQAAGALGFMLAFLVTGCAAARQARQERRVEQAAAERRRVYDYRMELWRPISNRLSWSSAKTSRYVALCVATRREQDVERAQLIDAGKMPEPPGI